ncbi:MAG: hypothetical protein R3F43_12820 [bacterium]
MTTSMSTLLSGLADGLLRVTVRTETADDPGAAEAGGRQSIVTRWIARRRHPPLAARGRGRGRPLAPSWPSTLRDRATSDDVRGALADLVRGFRRPEERSPRRRGRRGRGRRLDVSVEGAHPAARPGPDLLEINTIRRGSITGESMPDPRHALFDVASEYNAELNRLLRDDCRVVAGAHRAALSVLAAGLRSGG